MAFLNLAAREADANPAASTIQFYSDLQQVTKNIQTTLSVSSTTENKQPSSSTVGTTVVSMSVPTSVGILTDSTIVQDSVSSISASASTAHASSDGAVASFHAGKRSRKFNALIGCILLLPLLL